MEYFDFGNFFNERMRERGFNLKRLSELSGISVKHLEALRGGYFENLPSAPYFRGYLFKLGTILDFDADSWWQHMKTAAAAQQLKAADDLPKNRFSKNPIGKYLVPAALALFLIFYIGFRFSKLLGQPVIAITYPPENLMTVTTNTISLTGRTTDSSELAVNGEPVTIQPNGDWQKTIVLQPGLNAFEITAKKFLGRETKIVRQIIYQPPVATSTNTPTEERLTP